MDYLFQEATEKRRRWSVCWNVRSKLQDAARETEKLLAEVVREQNVIAEAQKRQRVEEMKKKNTGGPIEGAKTGNNPRNKELVAQTRNIVTRKEESRIIKNAVTWRADIQESRDFNERLGTGVDVLQQRFQPEVTRLNWVIDHHNEELSCPDDNLSKSFWGRIQS